ncbi:MAG: cytochrome C oxidase subunit IV family protein [Deltaproteobacteria bacterium]|nr:cytochrome C oxidase subunit IV family protein [Deltaproteobacteria bacterium]MDZ4345010.1 cytochrome C oxidase subunit IV family protein [Candidatus Binatia bacterium]
MSETAHPEPNYMGVFWWLLALTIIEVAVIYLPIAKFAITIMLITMAITKAALVALYFMHLKFERRTLALVAVCPFVLCVFLILMLTPDIFPH